jgi:threonine dehydrogenase-like Zn-dependent dehydrogenase
VRSGAGLFGYSHLYGGYPGGQAEFVRVPKANVGPLIHGFLFGDAFEKGLTFKMGQTHAQQHMPKLLEHIQAGDLKPEAIITHHMALEDAARGYEIFEKAKQACRKVVLTPSGPPPVMAVAVAADRGLAL